MVNKNKEEKIKEKTVSKNQKKINKKSPQASSDGQTDKELSKSSKKQRPFSFKKRVKEILEQSGLISKKDLESACKAAKQANTSLYQVVVKKNLISDEVFGKTIADGLKIPFIDLSKTVIDEEILKTIPEVAAKKQKVIVFGRDKEGLRVALSDPTDLETIELIKKKTGEKIVVYYATPWDIGNALSLYRKGIEEEFSTIIKKNAGKVKGEKEEVVEPPIVKIVNTVISHGEQNKASDIHFEPYDKAALVRFRIDGILHDIIRLPRHIYSQVVTRVKVMSSLRTDEHQKPQDGKLVFEENGEKLDIRVSIMPTVEGEKIVMRLLSEKSRQFSLENIGLAGENFSIVKKAFKKPYGMILSTGPTGCGKTTTQYAILKILNKRDVNIMTIEDPVEYDVEGINQIQVNLKAGLSFSSGLRSIVRQDPDIVLVGEIRDQETAQIAVNSAMTGHLVLSTLHTNDAATSLPRLLDMGIEPFLAASTVNVVIAQRLARKICTQCVESKQIPMKKLKKEISLKVLKRHFGDKKNVRVYEGKGCDVCHQTGFSGRVGIFEVLKIDEVIQQAIVDRADAAKIRKLAKENGMMMMVDDGLEKVNAGVTTITELLRVIKE